MLDALEAGDELEADKALLVPLDVLQKELVLCDVSIGEVKLNLIKKWLNKDHFLNKVTGCLVLAYM